MQNYIDTYIEEKRIPSDFESKIKAHSPEDLDSLSSFLEALSPSSNSFQLIYKYLIEISVRDKKTISEILADDRIKKIIYLENGSRKEKLSLVRKALELSRFPEKNKFYDSVSTLVSDVRKEFGIKLVPPDELEGDSIDVQFIIKSEQDLRLKIDALTKLDSSKKVSELFDILMGRS